MSELDPLLASNPETIKQFISAEDSNQAAHDELENYQKHGEFLYIHDITKRYKTTIELEQMKRKDPTAFMKEIANTNKSISRYNSLIATKKYKNEAERLKWLRILHDYQTKEKVLQSMI
ncbi:MAG: hypothetical protein N4A59_06155 [Marinifilum sp.]|nr:hypothetical protein [Marinifilum sp.]